MVGGGKKRLMFVLAVEIDQKVPQPAQKSGRNPTAVGEGTGVAVRIQFAAKNKLGFWLDAPFLKPCSYIGRQIGKDSFDDSAGGPGANQFGGTLFSQQKTEGANQKRFSCSRFSSDYRKT